MLTHARTHMYMAEREDGERETEGERGRGREKERGRRRGGREEKGEVNRYEIRLVMTRLRCWRPHASSGENSQTRIYS